MDLEETILYDITQINSLHANTTEKLDNKKDSKRDIHGSTQEGEKIQELLSSFSGSLGVTGSGKRDEGRNSGE